MAEGYDVKLTDSIGTLGLMLFSSKAQPKVIRAGWSPADPSRAGTAPEDETWSDWKNGFGYSQPGLVSDGYAYGVNVDTRSPGMVHPAGLVTEVPLGGLGVTLGEISDSFTLGGHYYLLAGRYALKVASGYGSVTVATDNGSGNVFDKAVLAKYGGTVYAWCGRSAGFVRFDGTTWTTTTAVGFGKMATVFWTTTDGLSVQRLIGTDGPNSFKHCALTTDPMVAGNWSASVQVADGAHTVTSLTGFARHLYIGTVGGVYDVNDLLETLALTPYHAEAADEANGFALLAWDGQILYGSTTGIDAVDVSQVGRRHDQANNILPGASLGIPNETPIWGRPVCFTTDAGWVVAALHNGTDSYLIYGKRRARLGYDGPGEWVWHGALAKLAGQRVSHLRTRSVTQSGVRSRRLWIATVPSDGSSGTRLYWQSLPLAPTGKQDADLGAAHRFATDWALTFTPRDWGEPSRQKIAIRADLASRNLGAPNVASLYIAEDDDADFGSPLVAFSASPFSSAGLAATTPTALQLTPKLIGVGSATTPAIIRSLTLRAAIDRELVEVLELDVWFARENTLAHGGSDAHATPEDDYARLAAMQNQVVTFTDLTDPTLPEYTVLVEPGLQSVKAQAEQHDSSARSWGRKVTVRLRVLDRPAQYDVSRYDTTALYSG